MDHNPYDLIPTRVNGQELTSRPIEFDSEVVDNQNMTNAHGNLITPIKVSTVCPDCGQGLEYDVTLGSPPWSLDVICYHCNPAPPPSADPFMNPVEDGRIGEHELDPLLHDPNQQVVGGEDESSVADRMGLEEEGVEGSASGTSSAEGVSEEASESPGEASEEEPAPEPKDPPKAKKKAKKTSRKPKKKTKVPVEPADGITEEEEIDDDDLVENE